MISKTFHTPHRSILAVYACFAAFGTFWGVWGASIPRLQAQSGATDGQLGLALLFIGAGALPAMLAAGRAVDRWGGRVTAMALIALGLSGVAVALFALTFPELCVGLAIIGLSSGASDVAISSLAGAVETLSERPVITRANAMFSSFVVVGSVITGVLSGYHVPTWIAFTVSASVTVSVGAGIIRTATKASRPAADEQVSVPDKGGVRLSYVPLALIGVLGALAFASENAHQSWGALFLERELHSGPGLSSIAPALFAGVVALARFASAAIDPKLARGVLMIGAFLAACGAVMVSIATTIPLAATGLVVAAGGTSVLYPTLLSVVSRNVSNARRGRATSFVATVAYLGFLLGPVYVGAIANELGLRAALLGVAALGVALFVLTVPMIRLSGFMVNARATSLLDTRPARSRTPPAN